MARESYSTPARSYAAGIGDAVADRTINRKIKNLMAETEVVEISIPRRDDISLDHEIDEYCLSNGLEISGYHVLHGDDLIVRAELYVTARVRKETWEDVAERVAYGNSLLVPKMPDRSWTQDSSREFHALHHHLRQASVLMSGRHLQHGDETQPERNMEVFTNCATSATSFLSFYLLLNGSGVGRSVDDDMCLVDWRQMPIVVPVISHAHADSVSGEIHCMERREAEHLYAGSDIEVFEVPDSREGWAQAVELIELMAFNKQHDKVLILDFSKVRPRGSPIGGMQNRPASGPGPLMGAISKIAAMRNTSADPWRQTMYIDHYLSECVLVGGARRAARMVTKYWKDPSVLDFIQVKRGGFLWSANNSVTVDQEFWGYINGMHTETFSEEEGNLAAHALRVLDAVCEAAYYDGTGEPGLINVDKLVQNNEGIEEYMDGNFAESFKYQLMPDTKQLMKKLARSAVMKRYGMITNPCGEISLFLLGGYCVIADVVPYHAQNLDDAEDAFRVTARALMRTNLMRSLYQREVSRTNRIGVGITGLHEFAWKFFGYGFRQLIDEKESKDFWLWMSRFKRAVVDECSRYAAELGVAVPHTNTTIKPAGTTSKLFGLTEGAHLPAMREYLRWVQFRNDDPLLDEYRQSGYPIRKLRSYSGTTIVGFPTRPEICRLGMGSDLVTAAEATPEEQYQYLRLLEKYWIRGVELDGVTPLEDTGNQVSYTLKYDPNEVSYDEFHRTLIEGQSTVRCCSVMPMMDGSAYEYTPEQAITKHEFEMISAEIRGETVAEDIGLEHVDCAGGACPVDFRAA